MSYMFSFCTSLKFLDISNFSSSKETNMKYMFNHCESLVNLVIRDKFNIYKENSIGMFANCSEELKDKIQNDKNISGNVFDESLGEFSFDHYRGELFNDKGKSEYIPFFLRFNSCYGAFNTYELINWKDPTKVKIL
jgi:surface protein